jgi:hypothetical protein
MRFLGILILLNVGLRSTTFKLLHKAKNDHPRGFGIVPGSWLTPNLKFLFANGSRNFPYGANSKLVLLLLLLL